MVEIDSVFPVNSIELSCSEGHGKGAGNIVTGRFDDNLEGNSIIIDIGLASVFIG